MSDAKPEGTTVRVVIENEMADGVTVDSSLVALGGVCSDGTLRGPFVLTVRVRKLDRSVPIADPLRRSCVE